jgi:hypothetical protein
MTNTLTVEVTYTKERLLFKSRNGIRVFGVSASHGTSRGLIWVEEIGRAPQVIPANEFQTRYPEAAGADRRQNEREFSPNRRVVL